MALALAGHETARMAKDPSAVYLAILAVASPVAFAAVVIAAVETAVLALAQAPARVLVVEEEMVEMVVPRAHVSLALQPASPPPPIQGPQTAVATEEMEEVAQPYEP